MKRFFKAMALTVVCTTLLTSESYAQRRPSSSGGGPAQQHGQGAGRPAPGGQGVNPGGQRPGNQGFNPGNQPGNKPGTPPGNQGFNPGNQPGNKPGNPPGNQGYRPGNPPGGSQGMAPGNRPSTPPPPAYNRPAPPRPPYRYEPPMHRPQIIGFAPPRPPVGWRPAPGIPVFSSIFGINFGAGFNISLNALINSGYNIYGYGNNAVYLNNVSYFNYNWPDATLYYGVNGLDRSEMVYSSLYYDMNRYNNVYNYIVRLYGMPYSTSNASGGITATWFAGNGNFITLSYKPQYGYDGIYRYYTILTLGI